MDVDMNCTWPMFRDQLQRLAAESNSSTSSRKDDTIIVSKLELFTDQPTIEGYFKLYGEVKSLCYMYEREFDYTKGPVLNFTRSCLVKFASSMPVEKVLEKNDHTIDGYQVNVAKYKGRKGHPDVFDKGTYELVLTDMPTHRPDGNNGHVEIRKCNVVYRLEKLFEHLAYNRIKVGSHADHDDFGKKIDPILKFLGFAEISFTNESDCKKAKGIAETELECSAFIRKSKGLQ